MRTKSVGSILIFALIFALAFYLRQFTFWLPHWQGDQSQYVMLAMKIASEKSLKAYNLSEVNTEEIRPATPPGAKIAMVYRAKGQSGDILESYHRNSIGYYDMPFFYKAPLFPVILALTHQWIGPAGVPFAVVESNLAREVLKVRPQIFFSTQFWAVVVPFATSLLIVLITFLWARRRFGDRAALYAAFILAVNPVGILTSNRLWTEDLMTVFLTLSMILYFEAFVRGKLVLCFGAGALMGLAVLTNQKSLLAASGLWVFSMIGLRAEGKKSIWRIVSDGRWWVFAAGLALVSGWWFIKIYGIYGNPLWGPNSEKISPSDWGWYRVLLSRPHGLIFYPVGTAAVSWGFAAGYLTLRDGLRSAFYAWSGKKVDLTALFCWVWIFSFAIYLMSKRTGEYRYLFPAYPALAAMSGWMLVRLEARLKGIFVKPLFAPIAVMIFLAAAAAYSIPQAEKALRLERNLIHAPWH
jgi:4-amino-4-deoxy-L-arabinose transferase-like glycosyltransferase